MAGVVYERQRVGNRAKQFLFNQISLTKTPEIPHPADSENTAITQFKIKITEIPHEKLTNTAVPQTPMSPSTSACMKAAWNVRLTCFDAGKRNFLNKRNFENFKVVLGQNIDEVHLVVCIFSYSLCM